MRRENRIYPLRDRKEKTFRNPIILKVKLYFYRIKTKNQMRTPPLPFFLCGLCHSARQILFLSLAKTRSARRGNMPLPRSGSGIFVASVSSVVREILKYFPRLAHWPCATASFRVCSEASFKDFFYHREHEAHPSELRSRPGLAEGQAHGWVFPSPLAEMKKVCGEGKPIPSFTFESNPLPSYKPYTAYMVKIFSLPSPIKVVG